MAGRFEGLSDVEWKLFEDIFPTPEKREVRSFFASARNASCSVSLCFE